MIIQAMGFVNGQLYYLFGAWGQANLAGYRVVSATDDLLDSLAHFFHIHIEAFENLRGHALTLAYQAEQEMFCADIVVLETLRFFLGKLHDLSGAFGELIKSVAIVPLAA